MIYSNSTHKPGLMWNQKSIHPSGFRGRIALGTFQELGITKISHLKNKELLTKSSRVEFALCIASNLIMAMSSKSVSE